MRIHPLTWGALSEECQGCAASGTPAEGMLLNGCSFPHASPTSAHSEILSSPKLAGELQGIKLGSLLPPKQIRLLEATFLSNEVVSSCAGVRAGLKTEGPCRDRPSQAGSVTGASR
jgi:hypothetical protein